MNDPRETLTVLRSLDPASTDVDPQNPRARADLARILATDPQEHPAVAKRRRPLRYLAAAGAAAAVITSAVVALPSITGGDRAFATWTATPDSLSPQESAEAADACRAQLGEGAGNDQQEDLASAAAAVSERRGAWTLALLVGEGGFSALCIADESTPLFNGMIGYVGVSTSYEALQPRAVRPLAFGGGIVNNQPVSVVAGEIGSAIVGVTYRSKEHGEVVATVSNGHFALWMPGDELENYSADGGIKLEVTFDDGTTETVVLKSD